jgi:hypothetical protein
LDVEFFPLNPFTFFKPSTIIQSILLSSGDTRTIRRGVPRFQRSLKRSFA